MSLDVDIALRRGAFRLAAKFATGGGVTALFGRSGSGKTTLAQTIAGLLVPDAGRITLDGDVLVDIGARRSVPACRRRIPVVFQDARLFPHLTVRQNLQFGAWFKSGTPLSIEPVVSLLGIGHCLARRPDTLSGGEQRRVAIGRALLADPRLLVLDEPMAGLDAPRTAEIMRYLERLRDELTIPMIFISHAMEEVIRLADHLVLLEAGTVVASGRVNDVLNRIPSGADYAEAAAVIETAVARIDAGLATLTFADGCFYVPAGELDPGRRVRVHIRARDVALAKARPQEISILNILPARVLAAAPGPIGAVDLVVAVGATRLVARITERSAEALGIAEGVPVFALIKSLALDVSPGAARIV